MKDHLNFITLSATEHCLRESDVQAKLRSEMLEEKDIEVPFTLDLRVSPPRGA